VTDAYIVSLGSCDMVLEVQWLSTLGSILWNFEDLTMEFFIKGRRHKLRGIKKSKVKWEKGKIREPFAKLFNSLQFILNLYSLKQLLYKLNEGNLTYSVVIGLCRYF